MLAPATFEKARTGLPLPSSRETNWHLVYVGAFLISLVLANQSDMLKDASGLTSMATTGSTEEAVNRRASKTASANGAKIATILKQRVTDLSLQGRVSIDDRTNEALALSINTGLLFSEGDNQLSRAGSFTLQSLIKNTGLEDIKQTTIILEQRKNTPVEFTYGKDIEKLKKERELTLQEFLGNFGVTASIRQ